MTRWPPWGRALLPVLVVLVVLSGAACHKRPAEDLPADPLPRVLEETAVEPEVPPESPISIQPPEPEVKPPEPEPEPQPSVEPARPKVESVPVVQPPTPSPPETEPDLEIKPEPRLLPDEDTPERASIERRLAQLSGLADRLAARDLNETQRNHLATARTFLADAASALGEEDLQRAANLADKAEILLRNLTP